MRHISLVGPVAGADAEVVLGVLGERSPGAVSLLGHLAVDKVLLVCPIILRGDVRPFVERDADGAPPAPTPPIRCRLDSRHAHQTEKALLSRIERPLQVASGVLEPKLVAALFVHNLHVAGAFALGGIKGGQYKTQQMVTLTMPRSRAVPAMNWYRTGRTHESIVT